MSMRLFAAVAILSTKKMIWAPLWAQQKIPSLHCREGILVRLTGIEPTHPAPEAGALSTELQAQMLWQLLYIIRTKISSRTKEKVVDKVFYWMSVAAADILLWILLQMHGKSVETAKQTAYIICRGRIMSFPKNTREQGRFEKKIGERCWQREEGVI